MDTIPITIIQHDNMVTHSLCKSGVGLYRGGGGVSPLFSRECSRSDTLEAGLRLGLVFRVEVTEGLAHLLIWVFKCKSDKSE